MVIMNNLIAFLVFNFFSEDDTYPYILILALIFDFGIYDTYFLNTIFFTILYYLNRKIKTKHHFLLYLIRNFLNLTIGLIFYSLINNLILPLNNFLLAYLSNFIWTIIFFIFHRKTLVIN